MTYLTDSLIEKNMIPDFFLRKGIRNLLRQRLKSEKSAYKQSQGQNKHSFVTELKKSPIALATNTANDQHYKVPTQFFKSVLGQHLKYSSGYWEPGVTDLNTAEETMLLLTCKRAQLTDHSHILELGCGWGSLTLYMAKKYPNAKITAVSNSATQKNHIEQEAKVRGLNNITIVTADMNDVSFSQTFDHIISVEMFEHMRNYDQLLSKVNSWLKDEGTLFVHIFGHRLFLYPFLADSASNWMGRHFFTGGIMPSYDIFSYFDDSFKVEKSWKINGKHYQKTCEAWLEKTTEKKEALLTLFKETVPGSNGLDQWCKWRVFFLACAELFGFNKGTEWQVYHYLLKKN